MSFRSHADLCQEQGYGNQRDDTPCDSDLGSGQ